MPKVKNVQPESSEEDYVPASIARVSDVDLAVVSAFIAEADPAFARFVEHLGPIKITSSRGGSVFESLAYAVVSQQVSTKAADSIGRRLEDLVGKPLTAEGIASRSTDELRSVGLSGSKTKTLQGLAQAALDGSIDLPGLWDLPNEEVHRRLTALWGIGRWTAEMTMIFNMDRLDVWPVGDLAVRRGWGMIHELDQPPTAEELEPLADNLRPYRSVVAWYCWRATDNKTFEW